MRFIELAAATQLGALDPHRGVEFQTRPPPANGSSQTDPWNGSSQTDPWDKWLERGERVIGTIGDLIRGKGKEPPSRKRQQTPQTSQPIVTPTGQVRPPLTPGVLNQPGATGVSTGIPQNGATGEPQNGATGEPQNGENTLLGGSMLIPLVLIGAFILLRK